MHIFLLFPVDLTQFLDRDLRQLRNGVVVMDDGYMKVISTRDRQAQGGLPTSRHLQVPAIVKMYLSKEMWNEVQEEWKDAHPEPASI